MLLMLSNFGGAYRVSISYSQSLDKIFLP